MMSSLVECQEKRINFELFEAYKRIYGNVHIRADFVVPYGDDNWPEELQGLKLGNLAERIRINLKKVGYYNYFDVEKLLEMGFKLYFREHKIDSIFLAFQTFKKIFGHCKVSRSFIVGEDDTAWPEECRGMILGETYHGIRNKKLHKAIHEDLIALGVDLDERPRFIGQAFERIYEALIVYKQIHGNLDVPRTFVVPKNESEYPPRSYGVRLGNALFSIKTKGKFLERRAELEAIGMVFHGKRHPGYSLTLQAFQAYKNVYGDVRVPKKYIVASDDPNFPPETWGLRLGNSLQSIRNHGAHKEHRDELLALGVVFEARKRRRVSGLAVNDEDDNKVSNEFVFSGVNSSSNSNNNNDNISSHINVAHNEDDDDDDDDDSVV